MFRQLLNPAPILGHLLRGSTRIQYFDEKNIKPCYYSMLKYWDPSCGSVGKYEGNAQRGSQKITEILIEPVVHAIFYNFEGSRKRSEFGKHL